MATTDTIAELPPPSPETGRRPHVPALDGVRGLAILLVLVHHFTPDIPFVMRSPLRWLQLGWVGVDLFFVLSGYLITGILLESRGKPRYFRNFYGRRTVRIAPLYYGTLFAVLAVVPGVLALSGGLSSRLAGYLHEIPELQRHQAWLWLYASNFGTALRGINFYFLGHFWSLAVEEHFYLVWPAIVLWLDRRALAWTCVGAVIASLASRVAVAAWGLPLWSCYTLTPCRLDGLALGGLVAILSRHGASSARLARLAPWAVAALLAAFLALVAATGDLDHSKAPVNTVGYTLLALAGAGLVAIAASPSPAGWVRAVFGSAILRTLGKYSYGLYVFNRMLMLPAKAIAPADAIGRVAGHPAAGLAAHLAFGIGSSLVLAVASYHLFEAPFLRLKRFFA